MSGGVVDVRDVLVKVDVVVEAGVSNLLVEEMFGIVTCAIGVTKTGSTTGSVGPAVEPRMMAAEHGAADEEEPEVASMFNSGERRGVSSVVGEIGHEEVGTGDGLLWIRVVRDRIAVTRGARICDQLETEICCREVRQEAAKASVKLRRTIEPPEIQGEGTDAHLEKMRGCGTQVYWKYLEMSELTRAEEEERPEMVGTKVPNKQTHNINRNYEGGREHGR